MDTTGNLGVRLGDDVVHDDQTDQPPDGDRGGPPPATRRSERIRFDRSASATESMVPRIGVIRGATIMAPMTVAVESAAMPAAAMIDASTIRIQNRLDR